MNSKIALTRMSEVMKTDTITSSQGDFMATNVPVKNLRILSKFEDEPGKGKTYSEDEVYEKIVKNPNNQDQFVIVYGASGAGKSHLIRWFKTKFEAEKNENEVVLFIRRSDNSLKGTIRQMLNIPEVKNLTKYDSYKKLVDAGTVEAPDTLKWRIYHEFQAQIDSQIANGDDSVAPDDHAILSHHDKVRLSAFLKNGIVSNYFMRDDGPIERIYSKVAGSGFADRDTVAQFKTEDFDVDSEMYSEMISNGADRKAQNLAHNLNRDDSDSIKEQLVSYLNRMVDKVIQRCANLEPGDFEQVFREIRQELYRQGKNLTLFIEDITSFTGVDESLLNVLTTFHTGDYANEHICRISSIVGTTPVYFNYNFYDNYKDRVTKFIYIPTNIFDENGLYEFFGRYLNTISLKKEQIDNWLINGAQNDDYPVHDLVEGKYWDSYVLESGQELNLYPFTKNAIINLVNDKLRQESQRTPRYILSNVMEPVLHDALTNKNNFPSKDLELVNLQPNINLERHIHQQCNGNKQLEERLIVFTSFWGNNKETSYSKDGHNYIAGINEEIYKDLNLPLLNLKVSEPPLHEPPEKPQPPVQENPKPVKKESNKFMAAMPVIEAWVNNQPINDTTTVGTSGYINSAVSSISDFVYNAINWQEEGISKDEISKIKDSSINFVRLENENKKADAFYYLPAERNSKPLLYCFLRYVDNGKDWGKQTKEDVYYATSWLFATKKTIVDSVKSFSDKNKTSYTEAAMASDIYYLILSGKYKNKKIDKFESSDFFDDGNLNLVQDLNNCHSKAWNNLLDLLTKNDQHIKMRNIVKQSFNIIQGSSLQSNVYFINNIGLEETKHKVIGTGLLSENFKLQLDDKIKQRRDVSEHLNKILERVPVVAKSEVEQSGECMSIIKKAFDLDKVSDLTTDEINDFIDAINEFYKKIDEYNVNVTMNGSIVRIVNKEAAGICKALKVMEDASNTDNYVKVLLAYSSDPLSIASKLSDLITNINEEIKLTRKDLEQRLAKTNGSGNNSESVYMNNKENLQNCQTKLKMMEDGNDN